MARKTKKSSREKNELEIRFLRVLGAYCKKIRESKGFSIHKLAKESDQLSTSVIHRLETGSSPVTVSSLMRYAEVLEMHPKNLLDFPFDPHAGHEPSALILAPDHFKVKRDAYRSLLPVYSVKAAAGYFGKGEPAEISGWMEVKFLGKLDQRYFIVKVAGHSMEPRIKDGVYAVFRANPVGTRQGKIVLAQYRGAADPDTGGSYTIKKYSSEKEHLPDGSWRHKKIILQPLNPRYKSIDVDHKDAGDFKILAEFLDVIP